MTNIPQKIYLQVDADGFTPEDFKELSVTWSSNRIHGNDIEYVLASAKDAEIERLKGLIEEAHLSGWADGKTINGSKIDDINKSFILFKKIYNL